MEKIKKYYPELLDDINKELEKGVRYESAIDSLDEIKLIVNATFSYGGKKRFTSDIKKLAKYLKIDTKVLLVKIFLQIGGTDDNQKVLNYKDKDNITIILQPKIKNYIEFKSQEGADNYIKENIEENELYLNLPVINGEIIF